MASSALSMKLPCVGLLGLMLAFAPHADAAVTCDEVTTALLPCVTYIISGGTSTPSFNCCHGIQSLVGLVTGTSDRQAICFCLEELTAVTGILGAEQAFNACHVASFLNTDCETVV